MDAIDLTNSPTRALTVTVADHLPGRVALLLPVLSARALFPTRRLGGALPDLRLTRTNIRASRAKLTAYQRVCGFPRLPQLPPTYPHVLAFRLQLALLTDRAFPLPAPGLIHLRNRMEIARPVDVREPLTLTVWAERFAAHRFGATVDICAAAVVAGEQVWLGRSTYLAKGATAPAGPGQSDSTVRVGPLPGLPTDWSIPAGAGRRYARVSGDYNPVHLTAVTARRFGQPQAMAHGMWITARALAALSDHLPDACMVDVGFRRPVFLPAAVGFAAAPKDGGWNFAVKDSAGASAVVGRVLPG